MRFPAPFALILSTVILLAAPLVAGAKVTAQELMPAHVASKLGLIESWNRTVATRMGAQSIMDLKLYVHESNPRQYIEVITQDVAPKKDETKKDASKAKSLRVLTRITVGKVDRRGNPMGMDEAKRLASNEIRRLKRRKITATMRTITSPRIGLYSIADDGTLQARDAETGSPLWMTRVGDSRLKFGELGVNDEHVTVVNGSNLTIVDVNNGEIITELRLGRTPLFGVINSGGYALVMGIGGGIECYPLDDFDRDPFYETVSGVTLAPPARAPGSTRVAWATDQGYVFAMELQGKPSTLFRLKTDGLVAGRLASASGDRFFFGSESGQVYGLKATTTGQVLWSVPFGEPFYSQPIVIEDQLFIRSTYGNLFCLTTEAGTPAWDSTVSGVEKLIGAFGNQLYVRLVGGSLGVIDRKTGNRIGSFASVQPAKTIMNDKTNRLYLVDSRGVVQCLRPIDSELPQLNHQPQIKKTILAETDEKPSDEKASRFEEEDDDSSDPFGAGDSDPFGAGADDPFGGDDDPFGN